MPTNGRPKSELFPSPNFKPGKNRKITCVVIHATATSGFNSPLEWLCSPVSKVSAHYLIGGDGRIAQLVSEKDIAWHAGESFWQKKPGVNAFSVGIELVNPNDGRCPYPEAQLKACLDLVVPICKEYGIKTLDVVGHLDVALGRKTDPAGFPWDDFRARLMKAGVEGGAV